MGKSERILLFKARFRMISSPKKVVQTSPSITFYTHGLLNLIVFSSSSCLLLMSSFRQGVKNIKGVDIREILHEKHNSHLLQ